MANPVFSGICLTMADTKIERAEKGDTSISFSEEVENFKAFNSGKRITILEVIYLYFQELQSK